MAGISVGLLDREITLQTATRSTDDITGQDVLDWDTSETIWAQWLPQSATEVWRARQIDSQIAGIYRMHWRDDVYPDTTQILGHDGRTYDVRGVTEEGRQEGLLVSVAAHGESAS